MEPAPLSAMLWIILVWGFGTCLIPELGSTCSLTVAICDWPLPTCRTELASFLLRSYHLLPAFWPISLSEHSQAVLPLFRSLPDVPFSEHSPSKAASWPLHIHKGTEDSTVWKSGSLRPSFHFVFLELWGAPILLGWKHEILCKLPQDWRNSTHLSICWLNPWPWLVCSSVCVLQIAHYKGVKSKEQWQFKNTSPNYLIYHLSKSGAQFPSPWVWATPSDSLLASRMWPKWLLLRQGHKRLCSSFLGLSLWSLTLEEASCHAISPFKQGSPWARNLGFQPIPMWMSHLENPSPAPAKPSDDYSPRPTLDTTSWDILSQNHPAKPLPDSTQKMCEIIHVYCWTCLLWSYFMLGSLFT